MITYKDIKNSREIKNYIERADKNLAAIGYTEHSFAHVNKCAEVAGDILKKLDYPERTVELAKIAAYMHDIGNVINRADHAQSGAVMAFRILDKMDMDSAEIAVIVAAIGHHDESTAFPVNEVAGALILADKSDVRRSRVRDYNPATIDIHDRVNYAAEKSRLILAKEEQTLTLDLKIDTTISSVMDYFEIFLNRMLLCRRAANYFNFSFRLIINGVTLL